MKSRVILMAVLAALAGWPGGALAQDLIAGHGSGPTAHDMKHPSGQRQKSLKQRAQTNRLRGEGAGRVQRLDRFGRGRAKFVELEQARNDRIFVVLADFGADNSSPFGGTPGPLHNEIAEPDRSQGQRHRLAGGLQPAALPGPVLRQGKGKDSLKTYYEKQSSGRYSVDGEVSDWVKVPYNEARYGSNYCGSTNCANVWDTVRDGVTAWAADQKAKGKTARRSRRSSPSTTSGTATTSTTTATSTSPTATSTTSRSSTPARTSPRAAARRAPTPCGRTAGTRTAPTPARPARRTTRPAAPRSATPASGSATTPMQPENGGLGVFAHEYGHDLGLPDLYDTSGGGENSTGFWSLMSAGLLARHRQGRHRRPARAT